MKTCSKCGEVKGLEAFHKRAASKDGLTPICRACANEKSRAWALSNPARRRSIERASRSRNRDQHRQASTHRHRLQREALSDAYISRCFRQMGIETVPTAAIEAKRLQLAIQRLVKEKSK